MSSHGWVYHGGMYRPFRKWREAKTWKGIERVVVVIRGKEVVVSKDKVKRFPEKGE